MKPFISQVNGKNYYLYYQHPVTKKVTRVTTKTDNKDIAELFKSDFIKNVNSITSNAELIVAVNKSQIKLSHFISQLYDYLHNHVTQSTLNLYHTTLTDFFKVVGNKLLSEISIIEIEKYKAVITKRMKKITVNKNIKILRSAFNIAIDKMELIEKNPAKKVELYRTEKNMIKYLQDDDLIKILSVVKEDYLKRMILFSIYSGVRLGELLSLAWTDIDYVNNSITIQNKEEINYTTKNKKFRLLSLTPKLKEILGTPSNTLTSFIFLNQFGFRFTNDYISKKFKKYCIEVGLEKFHWHCLRHTFATNCLKRGKIDIHTLQCLMGHSSITVTMGYQSNLISQVHLSMNQLNYDLGSEAV